MSREYYYAMYLQTEGKTKEFVRIKRFNNNNHDDEQVKKFAIAYLRGHCNFFELKQVRVQQHGREYYMKDGRKKIVRLWMEPITERNMGEYLKELQWYKENR